MILKLFKKSIQIHKKFETRGMHEFYHNYFNECHSRITDRRISRVNKLNRIENINQTILNANCSFLRCWYVRKKKRIEDVWKVRCENMRRDKKRFINISHRYKFFFPYEIIFLYYIYIRIIKFIKLIIWIMNLIRMCTREKEFYKEKCGEKSNPLRKSLEIFKIRM